MASPFEKYPNPCPSEFKVGDFVPEKLSDSNYEEWKLLMRNFIEFRGLVGFIDGTVEAPPERITVPVPDGSGGGDSAAAAGGGTKEIENEEYRFWKNSDALVRGWILSTLTKDLLKVVLRSKTAKQTWEKLEEKLEEKSEENLDTDNDTSLPDEETEKQLNHYWPLQLAAIEGDWKSASKIIDEERGAVRAPITALKETALHVAVRMQRRNNFVKKLLEKMEPQDLLLATSNGLTALHVAAMGGNIEAVKLLVEKNEELPNVSNALGDLIFPFPLNHAAFKGHREIVVYLLGVTREDAEPKPFLDKSGAHLLCCLAVGGLCDIALKLLKRNPKLACMKDPSPLMQIFQTPSSFRSGTHLNLWQQLIYTYVPMKSENDANQHSGGDIENPDICIISSWTFVKQRLCAMFWEGAETIVPQMKHIRQKKLLHHQTRQLVKFICKEVVKSGFTNTVRIFMPLLPRATSDGTYEIVEEIIESYPPMIIIEESNKQNIFQYAIVCRREKVFNLIYQLEGFSSMYLSSSDTLGNNGLHSAGYLGTQQQLILRLSAAGAALQMQRELQWFKQVENVVSPTAKEMKNIKGMKPSEVFTNTHQELVKEGERWMKDTANSCTIVAALIATVVFAAAITVPGGNNSNTGLPIFTKQKAFILFSISDAFALFSSITSVLMFLSILTARYAEQDFLYSLPKRLIIGLVTLFFSILSMMVAFGSTLYLVSGDIKAWIFIPVVILASIPVTLFAALQFPLLVEMIKSTYGPSIFGKQSERMIF